MPRLIHHTPSVGSLIKKVMEINPELSAQDLIQIVRESIQTQGIAAGEFATAEVVDEEKALQLAQLKGKKK
jgi:hypothetical protein